ncbi:MAG: hypothetical protein CM15mP111_1020 [Hyphomicrobiales bacterium]|nr:MAG: hypothetical protein CM15mP111_1020 [Hyphomicrobiales bacterium]
MNFEHSPYGAFFGYAKAILPNNATLFGDDVADILSLSIICAMSPLYSWGPDNVARGK